MSYKPIFINSVGLPEEVEVWAVSEFVEASAGAGDAGKPVKLNAAGELDASVLDFDVIDHDSLLNFEALEHVNWTVDAAPNDVHDDNIPNAVLVSGSRDLTGILSYDATKTFTGDLNIVNKKWVIDQLASAGDASEWQDSCLDVLLTPPGSPSSGDRYLINGVGTGAWATHDYEIAEWDGAAWVFTACTAGTYTTADDENDRFYFFSGVGPWIAKYHENTTASLGVKKNGANMELDFVSGAGFALDTNSAYVDIDALLGDGVTSSGTAPNKNLDIDWATVLTIDSADAKALKASDLANTGAGKGASAVGVQDANTYWTGNHAEAVFNEILTQLGGDSSVAYAFGEDNVLTDNDAIYAALNKLDLKWGDLASIANAEGASLVGSEDAGGYYTGANAEAIFQEIGSKIDGLGDKLIAGTGGVTKGDVVYPSAANTGATLDDITTGDRPIAIAGSTVGVGVEFVPFVSGKIIKGVLTGATIGDPYYWNGTTHVTPISAITGSGKYVIQSLIAISATDAIIDLQVLRKNAA